jgi:signal transduction histidine kinase
MASDLEGMRVGVLDTGPGLSPETLPRPFEPFYTTKPDGMGVELSIYCSIIETHDGRLWATGCETQGALFQFMIPTDRDGFVIGRCPLLAPTGHGRPRAPTSACCS